MIPQMATIMTANTHFLFPLFMAPSLLVFISDFNQRNSLSRSREASSSLFRLKTSMERGVFDAKPFEMFVAMVPCVNLNKNHGLTYVVKRCTVQIVPNNLRKQSSRYGKFHSNGKPIAIPF